MKKLILAIIAAAIIMTGCSRNVQNDNASSQSDSQINSSEEIDSSEASSAVQSEQDVPTDASVGAVTSSAGAVTSSAGSVTSSAGSVTSSAGAVTSSTESLPAQSASATENFSSLSTKKLGWGQGYNVNDKNQPVSCVEYNDRYGRLGGVFIDDREDNICLTFDEGYENGYTESILDTLKAKNVKAVFFVTYDYVKKNPDLIRRMIDEGHVVGNHSWSHPSMPTLTVEKAKSEIQKLHDYVQTNFGYTMTLFRPPMGEFSEQSLAVAQSLGYKSVFWSFAYYDYDVNKQPEHKAAFDRITKAAHDGGIFLIHAISKTNTEILGDVIDNLCEQGYTLNVME